MRALLITVSVCLAVSLHAQADKPKKTFERMQEDIVPVVKIDSKKNSAPKEQSFIEGTIPTPEEQGFTKRNVNGKEVYYKESKGIAIEYVPKTN